MSDDERDDTTEDETSEEPEEEVEPEAEEETLSGKVEVPEAGGGGSGGVWAVIIIVLAVLIALGVWSVKKNAEQEAAKEAQQRQQTREGQLHKAAEGIVAAETALQLGDVGKVVDALQGIADKLDIMHKAAAQQGDAEAADEIRRMRSTVDHAISDINAKYSEMEEVAKTGVDSVRGALAKYAPPAPQAPEEGAPAKEAPQEEASGEAAPGGEATQEQPAEQSGQEPPAAGESEAEQPAGEATPRPEELQVEEPQGAPVAPAQ